MLNNTVPAHNQAWRMANPAPNKRSISRYELLDLLGAGAMGTVYRAKDPDLGRLAAVKVMSPAVSADPQLRDRFHREARTAGSLQHPNIITVYEFGEVADQLYIAMEYVAGKDLTEVIAAQAPLDLLSKLGIGLDVLAGLEYAHSRGITHRDIKPGNIRLTADGRAKIMDFGIAHLAESELTNTGIVLGTPSYMAPELLKGGDPSPATDIFAVGAVLYELLTLRKPFDGDTTHAVLYKVLSEDPEPVHQIDPTVPRRIREIVRKAMAKVPETRYQSADAMAAELKAACIAISTADNSTVVVRPRRRTLRGRAKSAFATAFTGFGLFWAWDAPIQIEEVPQTDPAPELFELSVANQNGLATGNDTAFIAMRNQALDNRFNAQTAGVPLALLAAGDSLAGTADSLEKAGESTLAMVALLNAGARWAEAEASHRTRLSEAELRRSDPVPTPPPDTVALDSLLEDTTSTVEDIEPALGDDAKISQLVDQLADALESRDTSQLRLIYPGLEDREAVEWSEFFEIANNLHVTLEVSTIESFRDSTVAQVFGDHTYENDRGLQRRTMLFPVSLTKVAEEWRISHLGKTEEVIRR